MAVRVDKRAATPNSRGLPRAQMAELVDAPASGAGARKGVEVRVLCWHHSPQIRPCRPRRQNYRRLPAILADQASRDGSRKSRPSQVAVV